MKREGGGGKQLDDLLPWSIKHPPIRAELCGSMRSSKGKGWMKNEEGRGRWRENGGEGVSTRE